MNYNRHITLDNSNIIVKYTNERIIPASGLAVVGALLGKSNFTKKLNHIDVTPIDNSKTSKQGVSRTYKGFDGYAPIMAWRLCSEFWTPREKAALPERYRGIPSRDNKPV